MKSGPRYDVEEAREVVEPLKSGEFHTVGMRKPGAPAPIFPGAREGCPGFPERGVHHVDGDGIVRSRYGPRGTVPGAAPCVDGDRGAGLAADMIAPVIGLVTVAMLLYLVFAALFGSTAGVIAVAVLALVGFLGFVGSLIVSMR
jgi:hypothetical protein